LELLKTSKVQLVIADINMPGMDGLTFLRRLRADEQPHLRKLPVILLTANKPEEYRARGLAAGANAFLQKPVVSTALVETARQFLSS
jgi:two-component system chemotaxis response regulator CheY